MRVTVSNWPNPYRQWRLHRVVGGYGLRWQLMPHIGIRAIISERLYHGRLLSFAGETSLKDGPKHLLPDPVSPHVNLLGLAKGQCAKFESTQRLERQCLVGVDRIEQSRDHFSRFTEFAQPSVELFDLVAQQRASLHAWMKHRFFAEYARQQ